MTEATTTTQATEPAAGGQTTSQGQTTNSEAAWYSTFQDEQLRTNPSVVGFKTVEELAKGYTNLEKRLGVDPKLRIDLPADPNDAEGMRAVYARLGMPEKPDGYGLVLDDKANDADKAMLGKFTAKAHELGLPTGMAKGLMEFWMGETAAAAQAQVSAMNAAAENGMATLKQTWGAAFDGRMREIGTMLQKYGDPELAKALDMDKGGLGRYPNLALMLGKVADRMVEAGLGGQSGEAAPGDRAMTPDQAKAARRALEADPVKSAALRDRNHGQHAAVMAERKRLLGFESPQQA